MNTVVVAGVFDELRLPQVMLLEEAARSAAVFVALAPDEPADGRPPRLPLAERRYLVEAVRFVAGVVAADRPLPPSAAAASGGDCLALAADDTPEWRAWCADNRLRPQVVAQADAAAVASPPHHLDLPPGRTRVVVTGCYDYLHSGHVRFFEEVAELGDLYVVVGHDANIRLLKGEGHPLFPAAERRYLAGSIRHVRQSLISSGDGWLDAEPEIARIRPHLYAVNEDGDRPEKRRFCQEHGIEYRVLRRIPKPGLAPRSSTELRGF